MLRRRFIRHAEAVVLIAVGGILGANLRYALGASVGQPLLVTLLVNAVGRGILGVVVFGVTDTGTILLVSVEFCGAFTRVSSFSFETMRL